MVVGIKHGQIEMAAGEEMPGSNDRRANAGQKPLRPEETAAAVTFEKRKAGIAAIDDDEINRAVLREIAGDHASRSVAAEQFGGAGGIKIEAGLAGRRSIMNRSGERSRFLD